MPSSSRRILGFIESIKTPFTKEDLLDEIVKPNINRKKKENSRKKKYRPSKDISKIERLLDDLVFLGFMKREKGLYLPNKKFTEEGILSISPKGDSKVTSRDFTIIVKREDIKYANNNDMVLVKITDIRRGEVYGTVEKVIRQSRKIFIAKFTGRSSGLNIFRLIDTPLRTDVCSDIVDKNIKKNSYYLVSLQEKSISGKQKCTIEKSFDQGDESLDFTRIKIRHSLPDDHRNYTELADIEKNISNDEFRSRKDYRKLFTVTIDGEDAKDFDDAISIEKNGELFILYVHIADVSAYVKKGGEIDREAYARGTSYYLGNRVIPMLPEKLSNDLCSLKEGVERLTLSAEITIDKNGSFLNSSFHRGVIISDKRLTYNIASEILESKKPIPVYGKLSEMKELAIILKNKRLKKGRLDLNLADQKIVYDGSIVKEIKFDVRLISHEIIEEFMLTANEVVSKELKTMEVPALYRVHEEISEQSLFALKNFLKQLGVSFGKGANTGIRIQNVLEQIKGKEFEQVINLVVLKSLMQAYYGPDPLGHFGLGFEDYTHFTSPIRRYPDLLVHRCLKTLIDKKEHLYSTSELLEIGGKSSEMERIAQKAERDLIKIKSCRLMEHRVGEIFDVVISGISKYGFFISLIDMPIEGMVPLKNLTDDYYLVMEDDYTIVGKRLGRRFTLGDRIKAKLASVDIDMLRIDFDPA